MSLQHTNLMLIAARRVYEELGKFSGFWVPDELRWCVSNALSLEAEAKASLPMRRSTVPLVQAFCAIIENKKCLKHAPALINPMCDFILANGVQGGALVACLKALRSFSMMCEAEQALKNLQFVATLLPKQYPDVRVLKMIFSLSLSLCTHTVPIVRTTAFATSQQMISLFFNDIQANDVVVCEGSLSALKRLCSLEFEKPLYAAAYLLLWDICCMIVKKPRIWLDFPELPIPTLFRLWEMIISSHDSFLCSESQMLDVLESSVVLPLVHPCEVSFLVTFVAKYTTALPATSMAVFSYFLGACNVSSPNYGLSLSFFRRAFFVFPGFGRTFYEVCNPEGSLIQAMFESFDAIVKEKTCSPVSLTLSSVRDQNEFIEQGDNCRACQAAPIEITMQIVNSLASNADDMFSVCLPKSNSNDGEEIVNADEPGMKLRPEKSSHLFRPGVDEKRASQPSELAFIRRNRSAGRRSSTLANVRTYSTDLQDVKSQYHSLLELIWPKLLCLLVRGIRYADVESIDRIFDSFQNLVLVISSANIFEARPLMLRLMCGLVSKQRTVREDSIDLDVEVNDLLHKNKKGLFFKAKRRRALKMLLDLLYMKPILFNTLYSRLFSTLSTCQKVDVNPEFTVNMPVGELCHLAASLVKGNAFCLDLLSKVLVKNVNRFEPLFKTIELPLMSHFDNPDTCNEAISLVINASTATSSSTNDDLFVPIMGLLLVRQDISAENRLALLNQVKYVVLKKSSEISRGWSSILKSISLSGVSIDVEIVSVSFGILNTICNSHLKKMTQDSMRLVVDRVFEFAFQTVDMNISLSSFDLLWMIVSYFRQDIEYWKVMLTKTLVLSGDKRPDVAVCALRTFFSLIVSSISYLPPELFSFLIIECFIPQLNNCDTKPWNIQELLLQEACECSFSFWDQFETVSEFVEQFWPLAIEKEKVFMINCDDPEVIVEGLRFYDVSLCNEKLPIHTRSDLTLSFSEVINHFVDNEPPDSLVLSSLGRFVIRIIAAQKPYITSASLDVWLNMVFHMCKNMPSREYINLSAKKGVDGVMSLLPFDDDELNQKILSSWIDLVDTCGIPCVREELVLSIWSMFRYVSDKLKYFCECCKLFKFPESKSLAEHLLEEDIPADNKDSLFACYDTIAMGYSDLESMAETKLTRMLPEVSNVVRIEHIQRKSSDFHKIQEIWALYCAPESPDYNQYVYQGCFNEIVRALRALLAAGNDNDILSILSFLQTSKAPPKQTTVSGRAITHLVDFVPELLILIDHSKADVQEKARYLLGKVHENIGEVLQTS